MDRQTDEQREVWADKQTDEKHDRPIDIMNVQITGQLARQTDKQTNRKTDGKTGRQMIRVEDLQGDKK